MSLTPIPTPQAPNRRHVSPWDVAVWITVWPALVALVLEYGFEKPLLPVAVLVTVQLLAVGVYVAAQVALVLRASARLKALRHCWPDLVFIALCGVVLLAEAEITKRPLLSLSALYVGTMQIALLVRFAVGVVRFNLTLSEQRLRPEVLMVGSFLVVIVLGGLLLSLPMAMAPELRHEEGYYLWARLLNCLFTSVSATCVTGLVVYDTGHDFSLFGQIVILILIQSGGLGIMIFGSLFGLLTGRQLSLRHSLALQDALSYQTLGQVRQMLVFVVAVTFGCELIGAAMLYPMWDASVGPPAMRIFYSLFHAISAFCNAGFALQSDSLIPYRGAWQVYVAVMPLIVVGGLGFPVLYNLYRLAGARFRRYRPAEPDGIMLPQGRFRRTFEPLTLHTKLVLTTTVVLIAASTVLFYTFETPAWHGTGGPSPAMADTAMARLAPGQRWLAALFQAVTPRTAGFNTVALDPHSLSQPSAFLMVLLMFIGGSPASTAGGVKTASIAVLMLGVYSTLRGREQAEGFSRTIPLAVVRRASVVVVVMFGVVSLAVLLLCLTEPGERFLEILFETVSACGTVGLSTGLTPRLSMWGRVIIMVAMFAGRLGPLTLLVALTGRVTPARYEYPSEQPVIG